MTAYLDASCLVMLVLDDPGHDVLRHWLADREPVQMNSDFGWGEVVSAVSLRVRRGFIDPDEGRAIILKASAFLSDWPTVDVTTADIAEATALVARFDLKLRLPDAIHIAIVQRLEAMLVTSDMRQALAARALGVTIFNPLAGTAP